jgi:hypothetical protein
VNYIRQQPTLRQQLSTASSFSDALFRETDIDPTSKEVEGIPFGFAMAQED